MAFQQDVRLDFWTVLKRRKRSIRNFLELNGINNMQKFDNWLTNNSSEYIFSEGFKKEVLSHFEDGKNVDTKEKIQSIEDKKDQTLETKEESKDSPTFSSETAFSEIAFSVSPSVDSLEDSEDEDFPQSKKSKKKKHSYSSDVS